MARINSFKNGYLAGAEFQAYADLDGAAAAGWLLDNGATDVTHKDLGNNGLAVGTVGARKVTLSTNGYLAWH